MNIGINLVGVSYNDRGRFRDYKKSYESFHRTIVNPLKDQGHIIKFYGTTYESIKQHELETDYRFEKCTFIPEHYSLLGGGDRVQHNGELILIMGYMYLLSLIQLENRPLDLIISTRFDIDFKFNPFERFSFNFDKFNFLFKDSIYQEHPMVCDTFYVFKPSMIPFFYNAILESNSNPYRGVQVGLLNMYQPMVKYMGIDNIHIACDEFIPSDHNFIYTLTRNEH
jgi:hypothetical protein